MMQQNDFNKLPQLDRIEFRQKRETIYKMTESNWMISYILALVSLFIVYTITIGFSLGRDAVMLFYDKVQGEIGIISLGFIIFLMGDVFTLIERWKKLSKLSKEYFNIKVEVKNNGRKKTK